MASGTSSLMAAPHNDVHINDLDTCFDVQPGDIRGRVILQKHRYIVYESCFQNVCDGEDVPLLFKPEDQLRSTHAL